VTQAQILGLASELPVKLLSGIYWIHVLQCVSSTFTILWLGMCCVP